METSTFETDRNIQFTPIFTFFNVCTLKSYLEKLSNPIGGAEVKIKYGQTSYNSIRVCNTDIAWTYLGVTHEYVMSNTPNTETVVIPYKTAADAYILHDLSNLYRFDLHFSLVTTKRRRSGGLSMRSCSIRTW